MAVEVNTEIEEVQGLPWTVTVKMDGKEGTYPVQAVSRVTAKLRAIDLFLQEFRIPGKAWQFLRKKKHLIEVTTKCLVDGRVVKPLSAVSFYIDQVQKLRNLVRQSRLDDSSKRELTRHLIQMEGVLDGASLTYSN